MSGLPITKNEYDKSVILVDFLSEFKLKINGNKHIENVVFIPRTAGYCIKFNYNDIPCEILSSLNKSKFTVEMKVEYIKQKETIKKFVSKCQNDNQEILNQILPT